MTNLGARTRRMMRIASAALAVLSAACGGDGSDDESTEQEGSSSSTSSSEGTTMYKGSGPAKSPAGRPFKDVCDDRYSCREYFSADKDFSIAGDVGGWCTASDERCPTQGITGSCIVTETAPLGAKYDVVTVIKQDSADAARRDCEEEGGTWSPGDR